MKWVPINARPLVIGADGEVAILMWSQPNHIYRVRIRVTILICSKNIFNLRVDDQLRYWSTSTISKINPSGHYLGVFWAILITIYGNIVLVTIWITLLVYLIKPIARFSIYYGRNCSIRWNVWKPCTCPTYSVYNSGCIAIIWNIYHFFVLNVFYLWFQFFLKYLNTARKVAKNLYFTQPLPLNCSIVKFLWITLKHITDNRPINGYWC